MLIWFQNNFWWIVGASILIIAVVIFWVWSRRVDYKSDVLKYGVRFKSPDTRVKSPDTMALSDSDTVWGSVKEPEWYKFLQEELNRLTMGKIVFNPPEIMKLGVKDRIETRITRNITTDLLTSLKGRGVPISEEMKISELMKVRLSGGDFDILSLNEEEQLIEETGFTEWAWDVVPKKSGKKILHLHVTLRIRLPFGEERKDHPVLDREIVVKVNPTYSVRLFIISYWKWIVTALILPLIGLAWKLYIK